MQNIRWVESVARWTAAYYVGTSALGGHPRLLLSSSDLVRDRRTNGRTGRTHSAACGWYSRVIM